MKSKLAKALIFVLTSLMIFATALVIFEYLHSYESEFLIISILFALVTGFMILFIFFDIIIGRKVYKFQKAKIIVSRNDRIIAEFTNKEISDVTITRASSFDKSLFLTFIYNGKKHYVFFCEGKEIALKQFISGINVNYRDSILEYYLMFILEAFSI